jgi:AmmeMemoRadiSam system protein B
MENILIREAAVAGRFYPSSQDDLRKQIKLFAGCSASKADYIACVLPHAGYTYSGEVATQTLAQMNIREKIILLGPNHTGGGASFSISARGAWQTPLGEVKIDEGLTSALLKKCAYLADDRLAHMYEHSLEVQLPILQYFKANFTIAPIVILSDDIASLVRAGEDLAAVIKETNLSDRVMIVASSDLTHYEPAESAKLKDEAAIEAILALDEELLMKRVQALNITMCGYAPVVVMLVAAKLLGAHSARLVKYQTSGDVTRDFESVVGYCGIVIGR